MDGGGKASHVEIREALTDSEFSYDEIAEAYAAGVDTAPYNAHYERPATLAIIPDVTGRHILDAGCGSGFYSEQLVRRGANVTAVDGSGEMLKHAERRLSDLGFVGARPGVTLRVADLSQPLHFLPDHSVDGIVAPLVLHYMRDWTNTLDEFRRVLHRGGWLVMSTHHPATEAARFNVANYFATEPLQDYWSWVGDVRFYRRPLTATTGALADAGFVIERLVEPTPDEEFRRSKPEAFQQAIKNPDFLLIRARLALDL
jgi:ubiquinone/menaquinone biosynthesis C-methylase UbiE